MGTLLPNLVDNLSGGIHKLNRKNCNCFLECKHFKSSLMQYNSPSYNKDF